jgi:hypothetical protein
MDTGAPQPLVVAEGGVAWLSYRTYRRDHFAVLRFRGVRRLTLGEPDDERSDEPSRWPARLPFNSFHEVMSPELERDELRRWVVTFHDETLDVIARRAEVVVRAVQANDSAGALAMTRA